MVSRLNTFLRDYADGWEEEDNFVYKLELFTLLKYPDSQMITFFIDKPKVNSIQIEIGFNYISFTEKKSVKRFTIKSSANIIMEFSQELLSIRTSSNEFTADISMNFNTSVEMLLSTEREETFIEETILKQNTYGIREPA